MDTNNSDRKPEYLDEWKPNGPTEKGMVQSLADTQWQIHRATTLIGNLHPDENGELSIEQSQQQDRYSRHASRFKRDFERALKLLTEFRKERKRHDLIQLVQAGQIQDMQLMLKEDWDPPEFGFDLTIPEIQKYMIRRNILFDSGTAMRAGYDLEKFLAKMKQLACN